MVGSTNTNIYVRHLNNKQSTPTSASSKADNSAPNKNPSDLVDILDLSGKKKQEEKHTYKNDKSAAILEFTEETRERLSIKSLGENERAEAAAATEGEGEEPRPSDDTRKLTRLLVLAKSPDEVQNVLAETYNHMREWQKLAANGDKEAIKVVRKLNRLVSRGNRKITDLNKEIVMHQRQQRAENSEKNQEAKRLELELKEAQRERKARERRYLQERDNDNEDEESEFGPSIQEIEAQMRQLAAQMAALKTNAVDAGSNNSFDGSATTDGSSLNGGSIERGSSGGGEISGEESSGES